MDKANIFDEQIQIHLQGMDLALHYISIYYDTF